MRARYHASCTPAWLFTALAACQACDSCPPSRDLSDTSSRPADTGLNRVDRIASDRTYLPDQAPVDRGADTGDAGPTLDRRRPVDRHTATDAPWLDRTTHDLLTTEDASPDGARSFDLGTPDGGDRSDRGGPDLAICLDPDGDGHGEGAACLGLDCDESMPSVHQGAAEIACDRIDQDCDGHDLRPDDCLLAWVDLGSFNEIHGITQNEMGDGATEVVVLGGEETRLFAGRYMYFAIDDSILFDATPEGSIEIEVEFWDGGHELFGVQYDARTGDEVADRYTRAEAVLGHGSERLVSRRFFLDDWKFANRQNGSSDFRLMLPTDETEKLSVNQVRLLRGGRPVLYDRGRPVDGLERVWGVGNPFIPQDSARFRLSATRLLGAGAGQTYLRWRYVEPEQGVFDFGDYDANLNTMRTLGLRWVPFIVAGPGYSVPDWFAQDPSMDQPARCLEHHQDTSDQSIFNPALWPRVETLLTAFADHYRPVDDDLSAILLGISGTYGESIYTAGGNPDNDSERHGHLGYWAGDSAARASLRADLRARYHTVGNLNASWGTSHASWDEIEPFLHDAAPSPQAWWDFMRWYHDAMSAWVELWLDAARHNFPHQELVIVTGGLAEAGLGTDFDRQAELAATYNAQLRITNEGVHQPRNLQHTGWVDAATRFYGATCSHEPASYVDAERIAGRVFNARRSGCYHHFDYQSNMYPGAAALAAEESLDLLVRDTPRVDTAVLIARTDWLVNRPGAVMNLFGRDAQEALFDRFNFDLIGEQMVVDGALESYRFLVLFDGAIWPAAVLDKLRRWVDNGGVLIAPGSVQLETIQGDDEVMEALFGAPAGLQQRTVGAGRTYYFPAAPSGSSLEPYLDHVVTTLRNEGSELVLHDGFKDQVYTAVTTSAILLFNDTASAVQRTVVGTTVEVPPYRMVAHEHRRGSHAYTPVRRDFRRRIDGESARQVVLRNDGSLTWTATDFHLGHRILDATGHEILELSAGNVSAVTPPGALVAFPDVFPGDLLDLLPPGRYRTRFDMVDGAGTWFGSLGAQPFAIELVAGEVTTATALANADFDRNLGGWRGHGARWITPGRALIHPVSPHEPSYVEQSFHLPMAGTVAKALVGISYDDPNCNVSDAIVGMYVRVGLVWHLLTEVTVAAADGWVEIEGDLAPLHESPYARAPMVIRMVGVAGGEQGWCSEHAAVDRVWLE